MASACATSSYRFLVCVECVNPARRVGWDPVRPPRSLVAAPWGGVCRHPPGLGTSESTSARLWDREQPLECRWRDMEMQGDGGCERHCLVLLL